MASQMTSARWMTLFSYLGVAVTVGIAALAYFGVGAGPGAAILAIGVFKFGVTATLAVALLSLGFAVVEVRESPVRSISNLVTAGAAAFVSLVLLVLAIGLWFF